MHAVHLAGAPVDHRGQVEDPLAQLQVPVRGGPLGGTASAAHAGALFAGTFHVRVDLLPVRLGDQGPGLGGVVEGATQADALRAAHEVVHETLGDRLLDHQASARGAHLARVHEGRIESVVQRGVVVRIGEDDIGVLPAQFEGDLLDRGRRLRGDRATRDQPAREGDQVHAGIGREGRTHLTTGSQHQVGHARGEPQVLQDAHHEDRGVGGQFRRLEHEGVARGQGGGDLPRRLQQRVVPRGDQPAHTHGFVDDAADHVRVPGVDDAPGVQRGDPAEVLETVGDVGHVLA